MVVSPIWRLVDQTVLIHTRSASASSQSLSDPLVTHHTHALACSSGGSCSIASAMVSGLFWVARLVLGIRVSGGLSVCLDSTHATAGSS